MSPFLNGYNIFVIRYRLLPQTIPHARLHLGLRPGLTRNMISDQPIPIVRLAQLDNPHIPILRQPLLTTIRPDAVLRTALPASLPRPFSSAARGPISAELVLRTLRHVFEPLVRDVDFFCDEDGVQRGEGFEDDGPEDGD